MSETNWTRLNSAQDVAQAACDRILQQAERAIAERGEFHLVLAGGTTPKMTYELLAQNTADWSKWSFYFGDERCLGEGHADLNSTMAKQSLLDVVAVDPDRVHIIPSHLGAQQAADAYLPCIERAMPFDLVLLGMGEDGHTASIFPGHEWRGKPAAYPVDGSPKPPPQRVTLSVDALGNTRSLLYLITGSSKVEALCRWREGETLPVSLIKSQGDCEVLLDQQASLGLLDR